MTKIRIINYCEGCGKAIPRDAKPNAEYINYGLDYYHRACYHKLIGLIDIDNEAEQTEVEG